LGGLLSACERGNTDGGSGVDTAENTFPEFVSDGGAGGRLEIDLNSSNVGLGGESGFFVRAFGPNGDPLDGIRISCDTERGLNLIEPTSGGQLTGLDGAMSGRLCGNSPGSFTLECRAPVGFGLVDRETVVVRGDGSGFNGCPGVDGGLPGGGAEDFGQLVLSAINYSDAGGTSSSGPIDISQNLDCDGDGTGQDLDGDGMPDDDNVPDDFEPFEFTRFTLTVQNGLSDDFFATYSVSVRVDGRRANGERARAEGQSTLLFDNVDNCGA